jgi:hypothetical protein
MSNDTINDAIFAHRAWVARFQTTLKGINTEVFDLSKARDDGACELGHWLNADAETCLDAAALLRIASMHKAFHEVAWEIAVMFQQYRSREDINVYMIEFNNLSKQLVALLTQAKRNHE